MIQINNGTPCFLLTSNNTQTSTKTALLTVNYQTSLGTKNGLPQGYINSWVLDEQGTNVSGIQIKEDTNPIFVGNNILNVLTDQYILTLQKLNPNINIVNTL